MEVDIQAALFQENQQPRAARGTPAMGEEQAGGSAEFTSAASAEGFTLAAKSSDSRLIFSSVITSLFRKASFIILAAVLPSSRTADVWSRRENSSPRQALSAYNAEAKCCRYSIHRENTPSSLMAGQGRKDSEKSSLWKERRKMVRRENKEGARRQKKKSKNCI